MKQFITEGEKLLAWGAPISHAVVVDDTCYLSAQLAMGGDGNYVPVIIQEEVRCAFQNLAHAMKGAGFTLQTWCALLFPAGCRPAHTIYQVSRLP